MDLTYTLEAKHFQDFSMAATRELVNVNGLLRQAFWGLFVGLIVGAAGLAAWMLTDDGIMIFGAFCGGAWFFWFINYITSLFVVRRFYTLAFSQDGLVLGPRQLSIDDNGVHLKSDVFSQDVSWTAIKSISLQHLVVVLWTDRAAGIFVPRSVFANRDQEKSFVSFIQSKLETAPHL